MKPLFENTNGFVYLDLSHNEKQMSQNWFFILKTGQLAI